MTTALSYDVLDFDHAAEVARITQWLREATAQKLKKRGLVVAMSGGIDSSVCAALAVKALGPERVFGLLLPEQDSSGESGERGALLAKHLGIRYETHNLAPSLAAIGCYAARDEAIRHALPAYTDQWKTKIVIRGGSEGRVNHFHLVAKDPAGKDYDVRLELRDYLQIVAATNFKQRLRKTLDYFHADRLNYAVVGTPNRLEYDQGFFVKNGDGSADIKPIAHLYKSQVYALARHLKLPEAICSAVPTTDTYSLAQGQDEFYFALPYRKMDLALWAYNHHVPAAELGKVLGVDEAHARFVYQDIEAKRRTTAYLHAKGLLIEPITGLPTLD